MAYPDDIDSFVTWIDKNLSVGELGTLILALHYNSHSSSIIAIENTLGLNPEGAFASVGARLIAVEELALLSGFMAS